MTDWTSIRTALYEQMDAATRFAYERRAGFPRIDQIDLDEHRALAAGMAQRAVDAGRTEVARGVSVEEIEIPGPGGAIPTLVYVPDGDGPHSILYTIHAGGYVAGAGLSPAMHPHLSQKAAQFGCAVVYPDFRLPPEHTYPAAVEDCWAVMQWIDERTAEPGSRWDGDRIVVSGGCSGGNLAAVMALMARDNGRPNIALQYLDSAILDCRADYESQEKYAEGFFLNRSENLYVIEQYLERPEQRWEWQASPVLHPTFKDLPPALIVSGGTDILADEMRFYKHRLEDADVHVHWVHYPLQGHGFLGYRGPDGQLTADATAANARVDAVLAEVLQPPTRNGAG
jgi:acetyl esterase